jgi:GNAT superfamily N-acetyltransferase
MTPIPTSPPRASLRIVAVQGAAALDDFIAVPRGVFRSDPAWIQPLTLERRLHLSPRSNPYFQHARWQAWTAWRDGEPVGRISAQIDDLHLERYRDASGFFGMLDAEDSQETFGALLGTAERWLSEHGMRRVRGPFNLSINQEMGVLVDGFDTPPFFMMGHARPYYAMRIENAGYHKATDALAYSITPDFGSEAMRRLIAATAHRASVRPLDLSRFDTELSLLRDIFNDAWAENWGFVPFTAAEFADLGGAFRFLVDPDMIQIAEVDGEAAAFIVVLPNINEAIRGLHGSLFPTGWARLLWRLKVRYPSTFRVPLMGVRRRFQRSRLGTALAFLVIEAARPAAKRRGAKEIELSWILEDNAGMRSIIESIGGRAYKRYRVYERSLDAR